jgi:lysophospholipase L1-like esterase
MIAAMVFAGFAVQIHVVHSAATLPAVMPADVLTPPDKPALRMRGAVPDPSFIQRHNYYLLLARGGNADGYLIGDSILDGFQSLGHAAWQKEFAGWKIKNFACSGDLTQHVLWRLENGELQGIHPKLFIMLIGTNYLIFNTNEQIVAGNAAIIRVLERTNPQAKILLLGLLPRADEHPEKKPSRTDLINEHLAKLADGKRVRFLDLGPKFLDEHGYYKFTHDGLHPDEEGYEIFATALRPAVADVLGPPAVSTRKSGG